MSEPILFDPSDSAAIQIDWSDVLTTGVTLTSVNHTVESPLTRVSQSTDTGAGTSTVRISGAAHAGLYMLVGEATLSTGEVINRQFPIRGWNS